MNAQRHFVIDSSPCDFLSTNTSNFTHHSLVGNLLLFHYLSCSGFAILPACSVLAAFSLWAPIFVLRSNTGSGHGTPVEAQDVMIAKYLFHC
jgi:hypothetical protein